MTVGGQVYISTALHSGDGVLGNQWAGAWKNPSEFRIAKEQAIFFSCLSQH